MFQPAGRVGRGVGVRATGGSADCGGRPRRLAAAGIGWRGRCRGGALARSGEADVAAPRRPREQYTLQRHGAQDAALQMREDGIQPPGAEAGGDGVEVGAGGALGGGLGEVAAETEQDADGVQQGGDARGHGSGGAIRLGILVRGGTGRGGLGVHGGEVSNTR